MHLTKYHVYLIQWARYTLNWNWQNIWIKFLITLLSYKSYYCQVWKVPTDEFHTVEWTGSKYQQWSPDSQEKTHKDSYWRWQNVVFRRLKERSWFQELNVKAGLTTARPCCRSLLSGSVSPAWEPTSVLDRLMEHERPAGGNPKIRFNTGFYQTTNNQWNYWQMWSYQNWCSIGGVNGDWGCWKASRSPASCSFRNSVSVTSGRFVWKLGPLENNLLPRIKQRQKKTKKAPTTAEREPRLKTPRP